jgi:hypothetical protein
MVKRVGIVSLICFTFFCLPAHAAFRKSDQTRGSDTLLNVEERATQLKRAYKRLSYALYKAECDQEYFEAFPSTFLLFNHLFGYSDKDPFGESSYDFNSPLSDDAQEYVAAFFSLDDIDKAKYASRIIDLSINGRWYADGVTYFQHGMTARVNEDLGLFCQLLSKRSDGEIKSFWYFYFDGPHPIERLPEELQKVRKLGPRVFSLMQTALKEVSQAWKEE